MKHVNKHQTTQDTWGNKKHSQDKSLNKTKNTFTGINQSINLDNHAHWNNHMLKAYSNDI